MLIKIFAKGLWNNLSEETHKFNSQIFSRFFISKLSRYLIGPYCLAYGLSPDYLNYFHPESKAPKYKNFGDFFKRKLRNFPNSEARFIWPCEGYLCDWGLFKDKMITTVKGQKMSPHSIFQSAEKISDDYFFTNIFLHNHNYHRIHSPISGRITAIKRISGGLTFLRPWLYHKESVSYPALKNERLNIEISDAENLIWHISMVGGFGVGTIKISDSTVLNAEVHIGDEIGWFELGSTVCMASPVAIQIEKYLQVIQVGSEIISL